jgi:hypothetical protein
MNMDAVNIIASVDGRRPFVNGCVDWKSGKAGYLRCRWATHHYLLRFDGESCYAGQPTHRPQLHFHGKIHQWIILNVYINITTSGLVSIFNWKNWKNAFGI